MMCLCWLKADNRQRDNSRGTDITECSGNPRVCVWAVRERELIDVTYNKKFTHFIRSNKANFLCKICWVFTFFNGFNEFESITILYKRKSVTVVSLVIDANILKKWPTCSSIQRSVKRKMIDDVLGWLNIQVNNFSLQRFFLLFDTTIWNVTP